MTYYTGAWMGYGFHEDGLKASIDLVNLINLKKMIKEQKLILVIVCMKEKYSIQD